LAQQKTPGTVKPGVFCFSSKEKEICMLFDYPWPEYSRSKRKSKDTKKRLPDDKRFLEKMSMKGVSFRICFTTKEHVSVLSIADHNS
jgi:hypothetical protein